jgi:TolA-binding protein
MRCTRRLLAIAFVLAVPAFARAQATAIPFRHNYAEARQEAERRGVPLILYFTTDNCPWCTRLVNETFGDPAVAKLMNDRFVVMKVHARSEPVLVEKLSIPYFPTVILAGPDGKILGRVEGFQDAIRFNDSLQRALAAVANPEWMLRDYQIATKALDDHDYARAVALLRAILEDGKSRPVQANAAYMLKRVEQQAAHDLTVAKQTLDRGQTQEASALLGKVVKEYAGTQAAPEAATLLTNLAKIPEPRNNLRQTRAKELLAQAREDFRGERWLNCMDRCDLVAITYGDLPEAAEALQLAGAIRGNPDLMQKTCDAMSARLGDMYLSLAETWVQKGQPQMATLCLERIVRTFPGTRHAEIAQTRLRQLQGTSDSRPALKD